MTERHVSELLAEVFRRAGMKRNLKRAEAVLLWPRVVGHEVARFSTARALRDGVLYVDVSDSETAMHLSMQRSRFLAEYQGKYGAGVREIRFQVGRVPQAEADASPEVEFRADPQDLANLARELGALELPADVAQVALQAGRRLLALQAQRRAAGWEPCPTCGALHDGPVRPLTPREEALQEAGRRDPDVELGRELCSACRRYAAEGRVRAAAARLKMAPGEEPGQGLSEDEHAVAAHLAKKELDAALRELMPVVLERPAMLPQLERAARCRVALETGKPTGAVGYNDLMKFDRRLAQLLRHVDEA